MFTLGYSFRPWTEAKAIADGPSILDYVRETAARVRDRPQDPLRPPGRARPSGRATTRAGRSTSSAPTTGETVADDAAASCSCLQRLLRYDEGYTPDFAGIERFAGELVHPQHWTGGPRLRRQARGRDRQRRDRGDARARDGQARGARDDAPALADLRRLAARPTTRSPTFLRRLLPAKLAYAVVRWKNVLLTMLVFQLSRRRPELVKRLHPPGRRAPAAARLRRRHALQAALQPVGPAPVPRARRRPVRGDQQRQRVGRHRPDRDLHRERASRWSRARSSRPTSSSPPPGSTCCRSAASSSPSTASTSSCRRRWATRA